jgi:hypothetical protein
MVALMLVLEFHIPTFTQHIPPPPPKKKKSTKGKSPTNIKSTLMSYLHTQYK